MKKLLLLILLFPALAFADTVQYGGGGQASNVTFSPDGSIAATNVQDAIVEVRDEAGSGSVATDTIFDAAGDLVYGTGSDTSARLAAGATTDILVGGGAAAPVWTAATGTGAPARAGSPTFTGTVGAAAITATGLGTFDSLSTTEFTVSDAGAVVAASYSTAASATPGWTFTDSSAEVGVAIINTNSSGAYNTITQYATTDNDDAATVYMEIDGETQTVDFFKPAVFSSTITSTAVNNPYIGLVDDDDAAFYLVNDDVGEELEFSTDSTVGSNNMMTLSETGNLSVTGNVNAVNFVASGTILGALNVVTTTDGTESPTAAQMYGTMFIADHATATSDTDYTLPTAAAGMTACFYDNGAGAGGIIVDAAASDEILLNGAGVGAADAIDSPGVAGDGANGDFVCLLAIDATSWITLGMSGTWVDGGAD